LDKSAARLREGVTGKNPIISVAALLELDVAGRSEVVISLGALNSVTLGRQPLSHAAADFKFG
jgi:hypothetical protein